VQHSRVTFGWVKFGAAWFAASAALLCPFRVQADVYKSVDAEGHVIYSDRATNTSAQKTTVRVDQPDPKEVARIAREQKILETEQAQRKQQQVAEDRKKLQAEHDKQARCDSARTHYYAIRDVNRIFKTDADGNRAYYTDAEADAQREEARKAMVAACGS
jgi:Domain of unknown function (DUF4124)